MSHHENIEGKSKQSTSQDVDEIEEQNENQDAGEYDNILTLPPLEGQIRYIIEDTN